MEEFEKEHLKDIQSNCFWAGFLIDLPEEKAWQAADEIVSAIKFAAKHSNNIINDKVEVCNPESCNKLDSASQFYDPCKECELN